MPIKPENKGRYPANWKQIRAAILERAGHKCENCGAPQYGVGQWKDDQFRLVRGNAYLDQMMYARSYREAKDCADVQNEWNDEQPPFIVIVLTIAHLDHTPENCDPTNLRAWCQRCHLRCHLRYDAGLHAEHARETRRNKAAVADMFAEVTND